MNEIIENWCWIDCAHISYYQWRWQEFIWSLSLGLVYAVGHALYHAWKYRWRG